MQKNFLMGLLCSPKYVHHCNCTKEERGEVNPQDTVIYKLTLSNGLLIMARIKYGKVFMKVYGAESEADSLDNVSLQGMITGKETNTFALQELINKNPQIEKKGIATYMLRLLLTWIADYNEVVPEENKIKKITGTIAPLDYAELSHFKKFFLRQDKLTDLNCRIAIQIDKAKCEKADLYYDIV